MVDGLSAGLESIDILTQGAFVNMTNNTIVLRIGTRPRISIGGTPAVQISLPTGATLDVTDHNNNPIFRVDEDGDLHGKTGKALTFDL